MPSRPVSAPTSSTMFPGVAARAETRWSIRASPTHMALTNGFAEYGSAKLTSPATVGMPRQFP
jgi:hypothetical protein